MKKILILGGSYRDISLIQACQELGFYTITLGNRDDYIGHNYADSFYKVSYNNLEEIKAIIKKEKINFIIPGSGEEPYRNTVIISKCLNIGNYDSPEISKTVHNKWKFKDFCLKNNISVPFGSFYNQNFSTKNIKFPILVKPVSLSGGNGINKVTNLKEFQIAINKAKNISEDIVIEEFIEGTLISYSVIIENQKIIHQFIAKEYTYLNKYFISSAHPYLLNNIVKNKLLIDIERISELLPLVDGMFHLQIMIKNDIPYIIDVTRRIAGDLYPNLIELSDNVSYLKAVVKSYIGIPIKDEFKYKLRKQRNIIRHCIFSNENSVYRDIIIDSGIQNKVIERLDLIQKNTFIDDDKPTLISVVFIEFINYEEMLNVMNRINKLIYVEMSNND